MNDWDGGDRDFTVEDIVNAPLVVYEDDSVLARTERCRYGLLEALESLDFVLHMLRWAELGVERKPLFLDSITSLISRTAYSVGTVVPLAAHAPEDLRSELSERARRLGYGLEHVREDGLTQEGVWRAHRRLLETLQDMGEDVC